MINIDFENFFPFFRNRIFMSEQSLLAHRVKILLCCLIQVRLIYGYHQVNVRLVVVWDQYLCEEKEFEDLSTFRHLQEI